MGKNPQPKGPVAEGTISTEVEEKQVEERVAIGWDAHTFPLFLPS